jgi:formylglycine-generating enzyme required for sulfatase activity
MKNIVFQIILWVLCLSAQAQKVSNVRAEQVGQEIVVSYSLETNSACEINLLISQDNGATWGTSLKNVKGAVGGNISSGEKQINWKVLEERESLVGDKIKFKVTARASSQKLKEFREPEMVFVQGGIFQMGSSSGELDERPIHSITLGSFYIGKFEVTQYQWKAIMGNNPSYFQNCDQCPVESVSWREVQDFIIKLNSLTGKKYRLPTEAEWEYAAKGSKSSNGYLYSGSSNLNSVSWYKENSDIKTHTVGSKLPNEIGIYDMTGNVMEWCSDWYGNYNVSGKSNPLGPINGDFKVLRGGSWRSLPTDCRTSFRQKNDLETRHITGGFRLVLPFE